jgi:hypothetical protein
VSEITHTFTEKSHQLRVNDFFINKPWWYISQMLGYDYMTGNSCSQNWKLKTKPLSGSLLWGLKYVWGILWFIDVKKTETFCQSSIKFSGIKNAYFLQ